MTVIAAWKEGNTPFLLGDFMVTSRRKDFDGKHHNLPTRDDLEEKLPKEFGVKNEEPCQKIYVVSNKLAIGWTGCKSPAKKVIKGILQRFKCQDPAFDELKEHFCSIRKYTDKNVRFIIIGWLVDNCKQYCFKWDSNLPDEFLTNDIFIFGSGMKVFFEVFSPAFFIGERPIENALARSALILKDEVLYGTNLFKRFGGGIELIYFDGTQFKVLSDVLYIFLQIEETDNEGEINLISPNRFLKFVHRENIVEVMAVLPSDNSIGTKNRKPSEQVNHRMYNIFPINIEDGEFFTADSNLPLLSSYYCICVDMKMKFKLPKLKDGKFFLQSLILAYPEMYRGKYIDIDNEGEIEQFGLNNNFFELIFTTLKSINREELIKRLQNNSLLDIS